MPGLSALQSDLKLADTGRPLSAAEGAHHDNISGDSRLPASISAMGMAEKGEGMVCCRLSWRTVRIKNAGGALFPLYQTFIKNNYKSLQNYNRLSLLLRRRRGVFLKNLGKPD